MTDDTRQQFTAEEIRRKRNAIRRVLNMPPVDADGREVPAGGDG